VQDKCHFTLFSVIFLSIIFFCHFFNCVSHSDKTINGSSYYTTSKPYTDVAVYLPLEDSWMKVEYPDSLQFPWVWGEYELRYVHPSEGLKGYQPLWINHYFLEQAEIKDNQLVCGQGGFSSLYVDVNYLDREVLQTILEIAQQGFPVCIPNRPAEPGRNKTGDYEDLLQELCSLPNVSAEFTDIAVNPLLVHGAEKVDFWCWTIGNDAYIFFAHPQAQNLSYPLEYG